MSHLVRKWLINRWSHLRPNTASLPQISTAGLDTPDRQRHAGGARQLQGSAVGAGAPEDVASAAIVDPAAEHEEVVREAVWGFYGFSAVPPSAGALTSPLLRPPPVTP